MDLGEGPGGLAPLILGKEKKKSQKEEKPPNPHPPNQLKVWICHWIVSK